jgi:type VI protein secretion system component VasK
MTADVHRNAFTTFAAALMADFDRYVARAAADGATPDLARDRVGYRQAAVWVTDAEFDEMVTELAAVVRARMENQADGARRHRLITTVHLPAD